MAGNLWFPIARVMTTTVGEATLMLRSARLRCCILMVVFVAALAGCSDQAPSAPGTDRPDRFELPPSDRFLSGNPR